MSQFAITSLCYGVYHFQYDDFNDMQHHLLNINFTTFPLPNGQISSSLVVISVEKRANMSMGFDFLCTRT